jgi:hypothetical protein
MSRNKIKKSKNTNPKDFQPSRKSDLQIAIKNAFKIYILNFVMLQKTKNEQILHIVTLSKC